MRHMCVMAVDDPHFRLRIPEALKKRVTESAGKNHRSINAEIVSRLQSSFEQDVSGGSDDIDRRLREVEVEHMTLKKLAEKILAGER